MLVNDAAIDTALAALEAVWEHSECPLCGLTLKLSDGYGPVGPCDRCTRSLLAQALAALKAERETCRDLAGGKEPAELIAVLKRRNRGLGDAVIANNNDLRARIVAAQKALEGIP